MEGPNNGNLRSGGEAITMKQTIIGAIAIGAIFLMTIVGLYLDHQEKMAEKPQPTKVEVKKFRYYEQCPDGLRIEYVGNVRLPKSVVCQQAVGE